MHYHMTDQATCLLTGDGQLAVDFIGRVGWPAVHAVAASTWVQRAVDGVRWPVAVSHMLPLLMKTKLLLLWLAMRGVAWHNMAWHGQITHAALWHGTGVTACHAMPCPAKAASFYLSGGTAHVQVAFGHESWHGMAALFCRRDQTTHAHGCFRN